MCLITEQKKAKIARRDMTVYKEMIPVSDDIAKSPYQYHSYILGELYTTKIEQGKDWTCYGPRDERWLDNNYPMWNLGKQADKLICIERGYHACMTQDRVPEGSRECIYKCTIPKGSEYYTDKTGLIVSNQIIIVEQI